MAVMRNVVKPSNVTGPAGAKVNSSSPLSRNGSFGNVPNNTNKTARVNSSGPQSRGRSDVTPPNDSKFRFNIGDAQMGQPGSAVSPGNGDIPVNPMGGQPLVRLRDSAKR